MRRRFQITSVLVALALTAGMPLWCCCLAESAVAATSDPEICLSHQNVACALAVPERTKSNGHCATSQRLGHCDEPETSEEPHDCGCPSHSIAVAPPNSPTFVFAGGPTARAIDLAPFGFISVTDPTTSSLLFSGATAAPSGPGGDSLRALHTLLLI